LDGAKSSAPKNLKTLERMVVGSGVEIEWGGGIKSEESLRALFDYGAHYAIIGSVAAQQPLLFAEWLARFGGQRMVLGADVREGKVSVNGWQEDLAVTIEELIDGFLPMDLKQVICTDITKDGMLQGPSDELYVELQSRYPSVDFTVSGGIGSMADIERLNEKRLRKVIVGKAIYENRITLKDIEQWLLNA
jgi:phosphoribosylformimino-5-aminoimidazole carboxamide ribotide isomerase